jgi:hypothetical protein
MSVLVIFVVIAFVVGVLAVVGFALYEASPFPRRVNPYRDPLTHERDESPHLDDHVR